MLRYLMKVVEKSRHSHFFHAALVLHGNRILSSGYNRGELHAEVMAMNRLPLEARPRSTVWSIRVTPTGKLANAKPCPECMEALRNNRVKKVVYSTAGGKLETMRIK